jgi:hypothetical protein
MRENGCWGEKRRNASFLGKEGRKDVKGAYMPI